MSAIFEFKNVTKLFFGVTALSKVSFSIEHGHCLGLIGENGAGKSTLMNIMCGNLFPDSGEMKKNGLSYRPKNPADAEKSGIAFIHQELNLFTNLTIAENIFINHFPRKKYYPFINKKEIKDQTKKILNTLMLNLSPHDLINKLKPGERQLVEIGKALSFGADIIIFDEPTTSLTSRETKRLFEIIRSLKMDGKTIFYISHILKDILQLCDDIIILRDGQVVDSGIVQDFNMNKMVSSMCGRQFDQLFPRRESFKSKNILLKVKNLSQPGIVKEISMTLFAGEILGIFGLMGSGRSEFARLLFGLEEFKKGQVIIDNEKLDTFSPQKSIMNKMAFVTENRRDEGLLMDGSISDNLMLVAIKNYANRINLIEKKRITTIQESIESLNVKTSSFSLPVKSLSGGNQQKVVIGKWLLTLSKIFIMDEPTRGIDVGAKYEVYSIMNNLADHGSGILFISSEIEELMALCDRILVMRNGEISGEFNKDEFEERKILRAAFEKNS